MIRAIGRSEIKHTLRPHAISKTIIRSLATSVQGDPHPSKSNDAKEHSNSPEATETGTELKASHIKKKTVAQLDQELMQKMAGHAGDGGESGVEYEDGQPVAMKRSVKNNMFRYI